MRNSPPASRSRTWAANRLPGPATGPNSSEETGRSRGPPRSPAAPRCRSASARASTRAARSRRSSICRPADGWKSCSSWERRKTTRERGSSCSGTGPPTSAPCCRRSSWGGTTSPERSRSRHPTGRSTSSSIGGCSTRRSLAASGRVPRSTRPAALTGSGTSSRMSWR